VISSSSTPDFRKGNVGSQADRMFDQRLHRGIALI
jgi:hypothetical protein